MTRFPLAKLGAAITILGMTVCTFVSCQSPLGDGLAIKGHEFLRNKAEFAEMQTLAELGKRLGNQNEAGGKSADGPAVEGETLFEGKYKRLHWLYLCLFGLAVGCLFLPAGWRSLAVLGALGAIGIWLFVHRFNAMIATKSEAEVSIAFDWDLGATLALIGFLLVMLDGFWGPAKPPPRRMRAEEDYG